MSLERDFRCELAATIAQPQVRALAWPRCSRAVEAGTPTAARLGSTCQYRQLYRQSNITGFIFSYGTVGKDSTSARSQGLVAGLS
ncbi:MAG: hypothetical protein WAK85_22965, partial [Xanthobacteraceae bacterium]